MRRDVQCSIDKEARAKGTKGTKDSLFSFTKRGGSCSDGGAHKRVKRGVCFPLFSREDRFEPKRRGNENVGIVKLCVQLGHFTSHESHTDTETIVRIARKRHLGIHDHSKMLVPFHSVE